MLFFFRCVAEAIMEHGLRGLARMVPGGEFAYDVAKAALGKYRQQRQAPEIRAEIQELAQATFGQAHQAAGQVAREVAAKASEEEIVNLELYLSQIPGAVRQSQKRAEDPTGTTVPATFALNSPDDVLKLLPARPVQLRPGAALPERAGWVLTEPLGVGGFGEVWLAQHPKLTSLIRAVKFCRDLQVRDRDLLHESKVINRIMKQGTLPGIVPLLDAHLDGDTPWLMFEYVSGGDLGDVIYEWQALPQSERLVKATDTLQELAVAVGQFHRLKPEPVVHRDLKPPNILRDSGSAKLRVTDFGIGGVIARATLEAETRGGMTRGARLLSCLRGSYTPIYASPQQREGADPDTRDDVHALGVIGYQMITGQLSRGPGPGFANAMRSAGASEALITLLGRCFDENLDPRPKDADELAQQLATLTERPAVQPQTPAQQFVPPVSSSFPLAATRGGTITLPPEFGFGSCDFKVREGKASSFRVEPVDCLGAATEFALRRLLQKVNPSQVDQSDWRTKLSSDANLAAKVLARLKKFASETCQLSEGPRFGGGADAGGWKSPAIITSWSFCFSYQCEWVGGRKGLKELRGRQGITSMSDDDLDDLFQQFKVEEKPQGS